MLYFQERHLDYIDSVPYSFINLRFCLLFQELEEILTDVTSAVSEAICTGGEIITDKVFYNTKTPIEIVK